MALSKTKKMSIAYWVTTLFFIVPLGASGVATFSKAPMMVENYTNLHLPLYLMTIIGLAKMLGALAILQPKFKRIKQWAYAGFVINLIGASMSHLLNGDPIAQAVPPLVLMGFVLASNELWHRKQAALTV